MHGLDADDAEVVGNLLGGGVMLEVEKDVVRELVVVEGLFHPGK